jgi:hypothetical protein
MIIFINHMPQNPWFFYTPSRFGLSDAAETFVFLSGFAAALAYGRGFERAGLGLGMVRIVLRCGRIYAAHLGLFLALAALCAIGNQWGEVDYIGRLNFNYFFDSTQEALAGLVTLRYVPMYLDILPMYLVVMLWIPIVWLLSRFHVALALGGSLALYLAAGFYGWDLSADPQTDRVWFFDPFAWQFMLFTGFAFGAGWLRPPRPNRITMALALLILAASVPLGHEPTLRRFDALLEWRLAHDYLMDKTHLGILRWVHFLALAFLMNRLCQRRGHWLQLALPRWIAALGRQSLPMFLWGNLLSFSGGMLLDWAGRGWLAAAWANLAGLALMLLAARCLEWLDGQPWKRPAPRRAAVEPVVQAVPPWPDWNRRAWLQAASPLLLLVPLSALPWLLLTKAGASDDVALADTHRKEAGKATGQGSGQEESVEWQDGI